MQKIWNHRNEKFHESKKQYIIQKNFKNFRERKTILQRFFFFSHMQTESKVNFI